MKNLIKVLMLMFIANSYAQENHNIHVKEKFVIELSNGHECMSQTRTDNLDDAMFSMGECNAIRCTVTKKGQLFRIFDRNEKGRWDLRASYHIVYSVKDEVHGDIRYNFLAEGGSSFVIVPETESQTLIIIDEVNQPLIYFHYD